MSKCGTIRNLKSWRILSKSFQKCLRPWSHYQTGWPVFLTSQLGTKVHCWGIADHYNLSRVPPRRKVFMQMKVSLTSGKALSSLRISKFHTALKKFKQPLPCPKFPGSTTRWWRDLSLPDAYQNNLNPGSSIQPWSALKSIGNRYMQT